MGGCYAHKMWERLGYILLLHVPCSVGPWLWPAIPPLQKKKIFLKEIDRSISNHKSNAAEMIRNTVKGSEKPAARQCRLSKVAALKRLFIGGQRKKLC